MAKKTTAKRSYKLDIITVLEAADKGTRQFYNNLTEEEQRAFAPRVVMRWLSAVADKNPHQAYHILAVNDLINLGMWSLSRHPELLWQLMCVVGTGHRQYHQWIPQKSVSGTPRLDEFIQTHWPTANAQERQILKQTRTVAQWTHIAQQSGCTDAQLRELTNELKKINTKSGD